MTSPAGSSRAEGRKKTSPPNSSPEKPAPTLPPSTPPAPPLKPQKKLLIILSIVLTLWVLWLIYLYATTVYPMRHGKTPATEPQEIERQ